MILGVFSPGTQQTDKQTNKKTNNLTENICIDFGDRIILINKHVFPYVRRLFLFQRPIVLPIPRMSRGLPESSGSRAAGLSFGEIIVCMVGMIGLNQKSDAGGRAWPGG